MIREGQRADLAGHHLAPLLGASLLSAAGSLPLHLMPLIIVALIAEARASVPEAGWTASAVLLGQLFASLALPILRMDGIRRRVTAGASAILVSALALTSLKGQALLLLGWGIVGVCCGLFQFVGTITASAHAKPVFAFSIRLGIVLILAGAVAGALQAINVLSSYHTMLIALCLIFVFVLSAGISLYRPQESSVKAPLAGAQRQWSLRKLSGLGIVFILFVGQTGFLAYAVERAMSRGIALADAAWAIAAMKFAAGALLLSMARKGLQDRQRPRFSEFGVLLGASIVAVSYAEGALEFFIGLLGVEIGLNFLSARLQGKVAETAPEFTGRWLTGTILLGAASGPALNGALLSIGAGTYFIVFAVATTLAPQLWATLCSFTAGRGASAQPSD